MVMGFQAEIILQAIEQLTPFFLSIPKKVLTVLYTQIFLV